MKRNFRQKTLTTLLVAAIGTAVALPGYAANQAKEKPTAATSDAARHSAGDWRASKLIGKDVQNAQGESLGEIKDLILDVNNGRVYYAVLEFGGFLGLGEKLFAYPLGTFKASWDTDKLVLNVPKEKLKDAPAFARDNWPDWNTYGSEVNKHFGPTIAVKPMPNQKLRRASELIGKNVDDTAGKNVGEIDDVVVNLGTGKIHYAVLDFDKSWGPDDKLLALPMRAFSFSADHDKPVLNVPKNRFDMTRGFDKNHWPNINDRKYQTELDRYLKSVPASGSAASPPPTSSTSDKMTTH